MGTPTLLRRAEHEALGSLTLNGLVLDLGGDARSSYRNRIKGEFDTKTVNLDEAAVPDVVHDLEEPLPFPDESCDHVLLVNVLEHVYRYQQLLNESARVVKRGGTVAIVVPYLFPLHPSPSDYWRFSAEALRRVCADAGLAVGELRPLGSGVFSARYLLLDRLMPEVLRKIASWTLLPAARALDYAFTLCARLLGKQYDPAAYALGYFVRAEKV